MIDLYVGHRSYTTFKLKEKADSKFLNYRGIKNEKLETSLITNKCIGSKFSNGSPLTPEEVFSAIDGESYGLHEQTQPKRVNFDISPNDMNDNSKSLDDTISAIDGESYLDNEREAASSRTNYDLSFNG